MKTQYLGKTKGNIQRYLIENDNGMSVEVINYGARIASINIPSKIGKIDVVAGYADVDEFMGDNPYFNAVIGRVANRIGGAKFRLDGKEYKLFKNDGNNCLHGGEEGFDRKFWQCEIVADNAVRLSRISVDNEEGFPANLHVSVTYSLTNDNAFNIEYEALSDGDTVCSLTNHAYFNLDGDFKSVREHIVSIKASRMTVVDGELIPDGSVIDVKDTPFDFNTQKAIGKDIDCENDMLKIARGYDFNFVLDNDMHNEVATAVSKKSGVKMSVYTDRPCMQFYTGNFLDGIEGKKTYGYQSAFCMETQVFPNACNIGKEDMLLKKGEKYKASTTYKFEW